MRKSSVSLILSVQLLVACGGQEATHAIPSDGAQGGASIGSSESGVGGNVSSSQSTQVVSNSNDTSSEPPSYSRQCMQAHLARQAIAGGGSASAHATTQLAMAGAVGANVTASDLGLGSGDLTVLVLFDQSGSMSGGWDERSKWQVANDSLMNALEPVLELVTIGTIFFPQPEGCEVAALDSGLQIDFLSGRNFRTRWEETSESRGPGGSTPLGLAMQLADMALEKACHLGLLERRFRVVIVTDGEPNCGVDVETLPSLPAEWRRLGVETRVMGLPGSQGALDLMDRIAEAGGTQKCISLGTPQQMHSEMQQALL